MRRRDSSLNGGLAVEGMQHDTFQQVAQSQVVIFGEGLEDLEQALLHAHSGLHAFDQQAVFSLYHGTYVPR